MSDDVKKNDKTIVEDPNMTLHDCATRRNIIHPVSRVRHPFDARTSALIGKINDSLAEMATEVVPVFDVGVENGNAIMVALKTSNLPGKSGAHLEFQKILKERGKMHDAASHHYAGDEAAELLRAFEEKRAVAPKAKPAARGA